MAVGNLNEFPVLNKSLNINSIQFTVLVVGLIKFLLLQILLHRRRISTFFLGFQSHFFSTSDDPTKRGDDDHVENDEVVVERGEVEIVLRSLGLFVEGGREEKIMAERLNVEEFRKTFEERCPSLEEVKEAFDVFDSNRDGFIDAKEVHKVLCDLGMKEAAGSELMENCRRMIGAFDEDGDGRIDFHEFVKLMENSFS